MSTPPGDGVLDTLADLRFGNPVVIFIESVVVIILAWTLVAHIFDIVDVVSKPSLIGGAMYELVITGEFISQLVPTVVRTIYGLVVTIIVGTALGIGMGVKKSIQLAFQDYVTAGLALPGLFIAIFAAMWFGISPTTPTVTAMVIAFPFLAQQVYEGVRDLDNEVLEMASTFGVSRRRAIRRIIVPSVMPEWFSGVRYSLAIVWKTVILTELIATENGIGWAIRDALSTLDFTIALSWTILFVLVIIVVEYGILQPLESRIFSYRKDVSGVMA